MSWRHTAFVIMMVRTVHHGQLQLFSDPANHTWLIRIVRIVFGYQP